MGREPFCEFVSSVVCWRHQRRLTWNRESLKALSSKQTPSFILHLPLPYTIIPFAIHIRASIHSVLTDEPCKSQQAVYFYIVQVLNVLTLFVYIEHAGNP